jgi:nicotinamide-nucleotide amidase
LDEAIERATSRCGIIVIAMKASILAVGAELLAPGREETNSAYLTSALSEIRIPVVFRGVVGDDESGIAAAVRHGLECGELVILTGGLGPTLDDCTRDGVASALGRQLREDTRISEWLRARFRARGLVMPELNLRQAMVPEGAEVLPNRKGSAPGLFIALRDDAGPSEAERFVVLLPGPPREMVPMFEEHVRHRLETLGTGEQVLTRKLWVAGLPESSVEHAILDVYQGVDNPETTILAGPGQVEVRLTATAPSAQDATKLLDSLAQPMRRRLGAALFSETEESLEQVVGRRLKELDWKLTLAESITGGLIAHRITSVPGASAYFERGYITYSNESKTELLGVPSDLFASAGAVSEEVAVAMATGARERAGANVALSVTGIAGPSGGTKDKPVGLVFASVAGHSGVRTKKLLLPGERKYVQQWTAAVGLDLLRRELEGISEA